MKKAVEDFQYLRSKVQSNAESVERGVCKQLGTKSGSVMQEKRVCKRKGGKDYSGSSHVVDLEN